MYRAILVLLVSLSSNFISYSQQASLRDVPQIVMSIACNETSNGYYFRRIKPGAVWEVGDYTRMVPSNIAGYYFTDKKFNVINYLKNDAGQDFYDTRIFELGTKTYLLTLNYNKRNKVLDFIKRPIEQSGLATIYHSEEFKMSGDDDLANNVQYFTDSTSKHLFVFWRNLHIVPFAYHLLEFDSNFTLVENYSIDGSKSAGKKGTSTIKACIDVNRNVLICSTDAARQKVSITQYSLVNRKQQEAEVIAREDQKTDMAAVDIDKSRGLIYLLTRTVEKIDTGSLSKAIANLYVYSAANQKIKELPIDIKPLELDSLSYPGNRREKPFGFFYIESAQVHHFENGNYAVTLFMEEEIKYTGVSSGSVVGAGYSGSYSYNTVHAGTNNILVRVFDGTDKALASHSLYRERIIADMYGKIDVRSLYNSIAIFCGTWRLEDGGHKKEMTFYEITDTGKVNYHAIPTGDKFQYFQGSFYSRQIPILNRSRKNDVNIVEF